ncbi:hypothetical protein [Dermatobacter hominis]|uniref:hypothetical protein n=1 Tax=Dermatobacter hominis TaxID=2884263 RepID=UPI001D12E178|nr:hypothetical protein [Dermatobacter hominis]UDY37881.1 hypothetical protein LH044_10130 [Dermatobacter hominis]
MSDHGEPVRLSEPRVDIRSPFGRLALTHVLSLAGDALVAMSLAGSLFFDVDPSEARWKIGAYLLFTMAPFALVGPLIGPAMDRAKGGHRAVLVGSAVGRAVVAFLMIGSVSGDSLLLFPEAFVMLVLAKTYQVAKAAIVPTVVDSDAGLVEANSKLQLISGLAGFAAGIPGGLLLLVIGPSAVVFLAALAFGAAVIAALRVPATTIAAEPAGDQEKAELRSAGVLSAASAMGTLRAVVGFVTFLLAFALRGGEKVAELGTGLGRVAGAVPSGTELSPGDAIAPPGGTPAWHFGVIVALSVAGGLVGAAVAPFVRRAIREELLLLGSLGLGVVAGLSGALMAGLSGQAMLAFFIAIAASAGKQAFDAVVQRDAPDANRGRSFARFESRFQVAWVLGAFIPVVVPLPTRIGGWFVALLTLAAAVFFAIGMKAVGRGEAPPRLPTARQVGRQVRTKVESRRSRRSATADRGGSADAGGGAPS